MVKNHLKTKKLNVINTSKKLFKIKLKKTSTKKSQNKKKDEKKRKQ